MFTESGSKVRGVFLRFTPAQWVASGNLFGIISLCSCTTSVQVGNGGGGGNPNLSATGLDAGTVLTLTPPTGAPVSMPLQQSGIYFGNLNGVSSGIYQASNGTGGKDIAAFSVSFNGPPAFAWDSSKVNSIVRSQGYKVTWAGGDANSYVDISGYAGGNGVTINGQFIPSNVGAAFECQVPAAAGSFTIPASILLAMPAITGGGTNGSLNVSLSTYPQTVTYPGTDFGFGSTGTAQISAQVAYQ